MAQNKTRPTKVTVASFIAALPDQAKRADAKSLVKLMQTVTGEKPKMWGPSIIGFGSCHYVYESGREGDMPIVGFSPEKPQPFSTASRATAVQRRYSRSSASTPPERDASTSRSSPL
jgi:hypothetical protein